MDRSIDRSIAGHPSALQIGQSLPIISVRFITYPHNDSLFPITTSPGDDADGGQTNWSSNRSIMAVQANHFLTALRAWSQVALTSLRVLPPVGGRSAVADSHPRPTRSTSSFQQLFVRAKTTAIYVRHLRQTVRATFSLRRANRSIHRSTSTSNRSYRGSTTHRPIHHPRLRP